MIRLRPLIGPGEGASRFLFLNLILFVSFRICCFFVKITFFILVSFLIYKRNFPDVIKPLGGSDRGIVLKVVLVVNAFSF